MAQTAVRRATTIRNWAVEGRSLLHHLGHAAKHAVHAPASKVQTRYRIERPDVFGNLHGKPGLIPGATIGSASVRLRDQSGNQTTKMPRPVIGVDRDEFTARQYDQANAVAYTQVSPRHAGHHLDSRVKRRKAHLSSPVFHRRVEHQPDVVSSLAVELADQELAAAGTRFPRHTSERVARQIVSQFAKFTAVAPSLPGAPRMRIGPLSPARG